MGYRAHRYYYEAMKGPIPAGMEIDHLCRNTRCVNPDHLEAVTAAENARRRSTTRLSADDVRAIKRALARGDRPSVLARRFGVSFGAVSSIKRNMTWKGVHP
jgi:hypothetical protein